MSESALRQWQTNPKKTYDLLVQLQQLTTSALAEMRLLLLELRPASLTQVGLPSLIQQLAETVQSRTAIEINAVVDEIPTLMPDVQIALYRLVQEALNNIIKHAKASQISMQLVRHDTEINVMIEDNGVGFNSNNLEAFEGIGLKGIITRIEFLNIQSSRFLDLSRSHTSCKTIVFHFEITNIDIQFSKIKMVEIPGETFLKTLRKKLLWGEDKRN
jgi:signal transduction histidine kinase